MFDSRVRSLTRPLVDVASKRLAHWGVRAGPLTAIGWVCGMLACVAVGFRLWVPALIGWLLNRVLDGLDGAVARQSKPTDVGGFLDLMADFSVYAGFVVALALAIPSARLASVVLLFTYYLSGTAFLAASGLLDRRAVPGRDERSIRFVGGLAEGLETVTAYTLILIVPSWAAKVEWLFASMVLVTAVQRVLWARRALVGRPETGVVRRQPRRIR
jgi:phosphatidylglycerophosphate synthase